MGSVALVDSIVRDSLTGERLLGGGGGGEDGGGERKRGEVKDELLTAAAELSTGVRSGVVFRSNLLGSLLDLDK